MEEKVKTTNPNEDLRAVVAALEPNDTLVLAPGIYELTKHLTVDKDVVIKSETGNPQDVVVVRYGATTLLVSGGSPRFENLTFVSPSGDGSSLTDADDDVSYQSAVAVRGGSPTFVGCCATSADQSGFSVRGKGVTARLTRCVARETHDGGVFFDEGGSGIVEECLFADNGLGCVDCEQTEEGTWVEIRNSRLLRSGYAGISVHNGGRMKISDSEITGLNGYAGSVRDGVLEARSIRFRAHAPIGERDSEFSNFGLEVGNSDILIEDSSFSDFNVALFVGSDAEMAVKLTKVSFNDCPKTILCANDNANFVVRDCAPNLVPELIGRDDEEEVENGEVNNEEGESKDEDIDLDDAINDFAADLGIPLSDDEDDEEEDDYYKAPDDFSDEEWEAADKRKDEIYEKWFGPSAPIVSHSVIPYDMGGLFDAYYYPDSKYGGTFIVSKELVNPSFSGPKNRTFDAFELAMATRRPLPERYRKGESVEDDELDPEFEEIVRRNILAMTMIGRYVQYQRTIDRYETLEFPQDYDDPNLAGRCFMFDAIGTPKKSARVSLTNAVDGLFRDSETPPEKETSASVDEEDAAGFGIILIIEVFRDEMNLAREEGVFNFIPHMKEKKHWPFSDLDRPHMDGHTSR
ncbi:MAG: right-handed parallel beta-helix repeat-containing protein [Thermoguttaceae bacterium]|nr:right-handed parallel beta-helix repeat-containing protein [Thermoguttaceae bacterium]